jgi:hypothetical protein
MSEMPCSAAPLAEPAKLDKIVTTAGHALDIARKAASKRKL